MNDAVNDIEETTSMEESQTSEEKTTNEDSYEEDFSSSEDVNTQSDEEEDEVVSEALDEVKSPRGENRVQALANDKKRLAEENSSLRQEMEALRRQSNANMPPAQSNEEYLARQVQQTNQLVESTRQEIDWNEAARVFPELDDSSDKYDREFDNKVYAEYLVMRAKDPSVTPKQVAQGFKSYIDRITSKAASRAEGVRELKRSVSTTGSSRTEPEPSDNDYQKSRSRWDKTGSIDDLADVLKHV